MFAPDYKNSRRYRLLHFPFHLHICCRFLFEGQVLYSLLEHFNIPTNAYILSGIISHLAGLFTCGFFLHTKKAAKKGVLCRGLCKLFVTIPFYFVPGIVVCGSDFSGIYFWLCSCGMGYFLSVYTYKPASKPVRMF